MSPKSEGEKSHMKNVPYLAAMGSVMYLTTTTRPDIEYVASALARFGSNPRVAHWNAVKHLLCYLQGTANYALTYSPDNTSRELFMAFSDVDHSRCRDSRSLTGGYNRLWGHELVIQTPGNCCPIVHQGRICGCHGSWEGSLLDEKPIIQDGIHKQCTIKPVY